MARRPSHAATGATILHEGPDLLDLLRGQHTARGEQRFHLLFLHFSSKRINLVKFLHDRVVIRIFCVQKFTEFNVAQLQICVGLDGGLLRLYTNLVQAPNLLVGETKNHTHAGIFRHAQQVFCAAEAVASTAFPSIASAAFMPAEFTPATFFKVMRPSSPFLRSAATKLMLALSRARPVRWAILSPTDHRHRQENHKS
jgi:hypothetical protein